MKGGSTANTVTLQESLSVARGIIHDQGHLEVCLNYTVPCKADSSHTYKADFYFFIPKVMAISSSSYPKEQFYGDLMNYVRAHTPIQKNPSELSAQETSKPVAIPGPPDSLDIQWVEILSKHIENLITPVRFSSLNQKSCKIDQTDQMIQTAKLFANSLNKRLKEAYDHFQEDPSQNFRRLLDVSKVLGLFREKCVERTLAPSLVIPRELSRTILLVDEYLSNRLETVFAEVNRSISKIEVGIDRNGLTQKLISILQSEIGYRKLQGERFYTKKTTESEKEYFYYRQSQLKKLIAQPLFLKITKTKQERKYRNAIASVGAALAAVWSQLADHQVYKTSNATDFGFHFVAVAGFAILIYVFKDRIKDVSKEYFNEKLKDHIPDFKGDLSHPNMGKVGTTSEFVRFFDEKGLSSEVRFLRRMEGRWDVEPPVADTVLHYHRTVTLTEPEKKSGSLGIREIKDILRFNFSYFLKHLDDPFKQFAAFEQEERATVVNAPKVYHLNVVIRMTTQIGKDSNNPKRVDFERYRLIFNRSGILRMESLGEREKLFYMEGNL